MSRFLLVLLAMGCCTLFVNGQDDKKKSDSALKLSEQIIGTWVFESGEMGGMPPPEEFTKVFKLKIMKGGKFSVDVPDQQHNGEYKLNENTKPAEIDFNHDGEERKGIIKLEKGKVYICVSEPGGTRPTKFESKGDGAHFFMVLTREKK